MSPPGPRSRSALTLFSHLDCPRSHAIRLVLAIKGLPHDLVYVDPKDPPSDLMAAVPSGSLPTLMERDVVLYEARIIAEYVDERFPHPPLLPSDPLGRARTRLTAFRIDEGQHEKRWLIPDYIDPPGHAVVELILPASMKDRIDRLPGVIRHSSFDPGFAGETTENTPRFVSFSQAFNFDFAPEVLEGWQQAVLAECRHQRVSNFRKYHEPVVYRAATDFTYRHGLLDRTFPETAS